MDSSSAIQDIQFISIKVTRRRNSKDNCSRHDFSNCTHAIKILSEKEKVSQDFVGPFFSQQMNGREEGDFFLQGHS